MFTGLIETKGKLLRRTASGPDARLVIEGTLAGEPLALGESIAVDGVCLTVAEILPGGRGFHADASAETLAKTTLGDVAAGAEVNLERALALGARMGGHIVSGHVDGVGRVASKSPVGVAVKVVFAAPKELMRFIAPKGSICVSGVSLTVNGVSGDEFDVVLVPHTQEKVTLGARVNLEVDLLARYVARILESGDENSNWIARLSRAGYM